MSTFQVTLQDLPGYHITADCTPNKRISALIEQFREEAGIPSINKRQRITLTRKEGELKKETLGENGIRNTITLMVAYHGDISCIAPEPIAPHVYTWIYQQKPILFYDPTRQEQEAVLISMEDIPLPHRAKTYHADCTELLAEYNEWITGQEYRFFLTHAPPRVQRSFPWYRSDNQVEKNRIIRYVPTVGPDFPLNITLYPQGLPSDSHGLMWLDPFSSVKGTLHSIKLYVTVKPLPAPTHGDYECKYHFNVFLKGPIEIRDDHGTFVESFEEEAFCVIKYDHIVTCDDMGGPMIPDAVANAVAEAVEAVASANAGPTANAANRNQGGRRLTRSKPKPKPKPKPKRKTRRTKRRI
jgi:hypothetical protein